MKLAAVLACSLLGITLVVIGYCLPTWGSGGWTEEKQQRMNFVGLKIQALHYAGKDHTHPVPQEDPASQDPVSVAPVGTGQSPGGLAPNASVAEQEANLRSEFEQLRRDLRAAQNQRRLLPAALLWVGIASLGVGLVMGLTIRSN